MMTIHLNLKAELTQVLQKSLQPQQKVLRKRVAKKKKPVDFINATWADAGPIAIRTEIKIADKIKEKADSKKIKDTDQTDTTEATAGHPHAR